MLHSECLTNTCSGGKTIETGKIRIIRVIHVSDRVFTVTFPVKELYPWAESIYLESKYINSVTILFKYSSLSHFKAKNILLIVEKVFIDKIHRNLKLKNMASANS